jgi:hypothetical protein
MTAMTPPPDGPAPADSASSAAANDRAQPPHPFRSAPWYDPRLVATSAAPQPKRLVARTVLVSLAAIALPVVSVLINASMEVVALGPWGVVLVLLSALPPLAQLVWMPIKRRDKQSPVEVLAPRSTVGLALLLSASLSSALLWVYLGALFLPILPLSVVALIIFGLGLCGLCPYLAGGISVLHSVRTVRLLAQRLGRSRTAALVAVVLLAPVAAATFSGLHAANERRALAAKLDRVVKAPPFSTARMRAIASLEPQLSRLPAALAEEGDAGRRRALSEAYQRLTDQRLDLWRMVRRERRGQIRPFWFAEGRSPISFHLLGPIGRL